MTVYRTCRGCVHDSPDCETRAAVRRQLKGLCATSIKWRCKERVPMFKRGDAVWCKTVGDWSGSITYPGDEPTIDEYPGHVIKTSDTHVFVYIPTGAPGRSWGEDYEFSPKAGGFCKFPFSRVSWREADAATLCPECDLPDWAGHQNGYSCSYRGEKHDTDPQGQI